MSFLYFAYGSNLWVPRMRSRCPSASPVGTTALEGWKVVYDKPSTDDSTKLNIRPVPGESAPGVLYEIEDGERQALDAAEPGYRPIAIDVEGRRVLTYTYEDQPHRCSPYDWYVSTALAGAAQHGLPEDHLNVQHHPDPIAPGIRPASLDDVGLIMSILSEGLGSDTGRYYVHPGDYAWWIHHDDPRHPDHFSTWIQGDSAFVTIDWLEPHEVSLFTRPGVDRMPLLRWAQSRLRHRGEVGWVADGDTELVGALETEGYSPVFAHRQYEWKLTGRLPEPRLPGGWTLRPVRGEHEANARQAAAHAAFESTMPEAMHLQRYLCFMRSPAYVPERDLVAVDPEGRIASFMIWWADEHGIAQIEPFGTHPDYHRQGAGRALLYHGLGEMRRAGMEMVRVCTDDGWEATKFYEGVGFSDVGRLRWWKKT